VVVDIVYEPHPYPWKGEGHTDCWVEAVWKMLGVENQAEGFVRVPLNAKVETVHVDLAEVVVNVRVVPGETSTGMEGLRLGVLSSTVGGLVAVKSRPLACRGCEFFEGA